MLSQHADDLGRTPTYASSEITLLFGLHATADDVAWRVDQIEKAIRRHPEASRHLVLMESGIPSTLPSTVSELQQMYDEARLQHTVLPTVDWAAIIQSDSMTDEQRQLLRKLHGAGISEFVNRCDACPDGSHELQGRPEWMPISHLIASLIKEGLKVKCGFELFSLDSFILALRHSQLLDDANVAGRKGDLSKVCEALLLENGLGWRSDSIRDRHLAELIIGIRGKNPGAHIVVERGAAHRNSLEAQLRSAGPKFDSFVKEDIRRPYIEVSKPDFWKGADDSPTPTQIAQSMREAAISLSQLSDPRQEAQLAGCLASIPDEHLIDVKQGSADVRLHGIVAMKTFIFEQLAVKGHDIRI
jgi:hypothetical protein